MAHFYIPFQPLRRRIFNLHRAILFPFEKGCFLRRNARYSGKRKPPAAGTDRGRAHGYGPGAGLDVPVIRFVQQLPQARAVLGAAA